MIFSEIGISPPSRTARRDLPLQQKKAKPKQRNGGKRKQSSHLACFLPSPLSGVLERKKDEGAEKPDCRKEERRTPGSGSRA